MEDMNKILSEYCKTLRKGKNSLLKERDYLYQNYCMSENFLRIATEEKTILHYEYFLYETKEKINIVEKLLQKFVE